MKKLLSIFLTAVMVLSILPFSTVSAAKTSKYDKYIEYRGQNLRNTYAKLKNDKKLNVVYFGGSVTNGTGVSNSNADSWRALIGEWLVDSFPNATIKNMNKAIGATGTKLGAYRVDHNVIKAKPDLVFVEFAINDYYDNQLEQLDPSEYGMRFESIVRNIRKALPKCDIIAIYTTEKSHVSTNQAGDLFSQAKAHEEICKAYDIPSIDVGAALADKITPGRVKEEWGKYSNDDVHPNMDGYKIYYNAIKEYMNNCLSYGGYDGTSKNHKLPKMVNDYLLDGNIKVIDVDEELTNKSRSSGGGNFEYSTTAIIADVYRPFGDDGASVIDCNTSASFVVEFTGTELVILEYSSNVEYFSIKIDGGKEKSVSRQVTPTVLVSGLEYGKHTAVVKVFFKSSGKKEFGIKAFFVRDERARSVKYDHTHSYGKYVSDKNATCKRDGTKTAKCKVSGCDMVKTVTDTGSKKEHSYKTVITKKATTSKNGSGEKVCDSCGRFESLVTINKIKTVKLSTKKYTYNGKTKKPKVVVKDSKGKTISSKYYTVSGTKSAKKIGEYKITIKFKGKYSGKKTLKYEIVKPTVKKSSVSKLTASKKSLKVKLKKTKSISGYEIKYSTSKKFAKKYTKTKTLKGYKKTSITLKKLKSKKTYYVKVRSYKTVGGKKFYSSWSKAKSKKTK